MNCCSPNQLAGFLALSVFAFVQLALSRPDALIEKLNSSEFSIIFNGTLERSGNGVDWVAVDPQPTSPWRINLSSTPVFYRSSQEAGPLANPLIDVENFEYIGGFRMPTSITGDEGSVTQYTDARLAINRDRNSMYFSGFWAAGTDRGVIGEMSIPELVDSESIEDMNFATQLQDMVYAFKDNDIGLDRIGGLLHKDGKLLILAYDTFDTYPYTKHNARISANPNDLENDPQFSDYFILGTPIDGETTTHYVSWNTPIPAEWQELLGGDYILGSSNYMSINARSSMGPSAFVYRSDDVFNSEAPHTSESDPIATRTTLLDFDLDHILADNEAGWVDFDEWANTGLQFAYSGPQNKAPWDQWIYDPDLVLHDVLWTQGSAGKIGFIVPGTRTYAVIGRARYLQHGAGYKIIRNDGYHCNGECSYDPLDSINYMWLWDLGELLDVKNGIKQPYEAKPYFHGELETPFHYNEAADEMAEISGGTFDEANEILYLSITQADTRGSRHMPLILAYRINVSGE